METQETNNTRQTTIYVGPDLQAAGVNAPFTVTAGTTMTVTDSVRNIGAEVAGASTTRFYLSLNGTLDAADVLLDGERTVAAIAVNGISSGTTALLIPAGLSAGTTCSRSPTPSAPSPNRARSTTCRCDRSPSTPSADHTLRGSRMSRRSHGTRNTQIVTKFTGRESRGS